ncbi:MAG: phage head closure protein [Clostridium paraputrificum]
MAKFKVDIGKLNKRISIGHIGSIVNPNGFPETKFLEDYKAWASISNLYGKEFYEAAAVQHEDDVKFIIRYNSNITYKNVIKYEEDIYTIVHIDNVEFSNRWLVIKAKILDKDRSDSQ